MESVRVGSFSFKINIFYPILFLDIFDFIPTRNYGNCGFY